MMTLEWRYRALVLRLLINILGRLCQGEPYPYETQSIREANDMLDEFRRNA